MSSTKQRTHFDVVWAVGLLRAEEEDGRDFDYLVSEVCERLGASAEKWTDDDVRRDLDDDVGVTSAVVVRWTLRTAQGGDVAPFVNEMADRLAGISRKRAGVLSIPQMRGLWNFIRAAHRRREAAEAGPPPIRFDAVPTFLADLAARIEYPKVALPLAGGGEVWLSVAGARARFPGSINAASSGRYGEGRWFGRLVNGVPDEALLREQEVLDAIGNLDANPTFEYAVEAHGRTTGRCMACHRTLTVKESVKRGIGPVCGQRLGLVDDRRAAANAPVNEAPQEAS